MRRLFMPGGPARQRKPSPEGLRHDATTRRSAVGAALDSLSIRGEITILLVLFSKWIPWPRSLRISSAVDDTRRYLQIDLCSAVLGTPHAQLPAHLAGAFPHTRQAPVAAALTSLHHALINAAA